MNTAPLDATLELTDSAWDHMGAVVFGEETTLAAVKTVTETWMQSRDTFTRPVSVTAEMKADRAECITMSLFADSHEKNAPYPSRQEVGQRRSGCFPRLSRGGRHQRSLAQRQDQGDLDGEVLFAGRHRQVHRH